MTTQWRVSIIDSYKVEWWLTIVATHTELEELSGFGYYLGFLTMVRSSSHEMTNEPL